MSSVLGKRGGFESSAEMVVNMQDAKTSATEAVKDLNGNFDAMMYSRILMFLCKHCQRFAGTAVTPAPAQSERRRVCLRVRQDVIRRFEGHAGRFRNRRGQRIQERLSRAVDVPA